MGCGDSKVEQHKKPVVLKPYNRRKKVEVHQAERARNLKSAPIVIFIFGGPGSKKGRIVDDLRISYGFHFINGEEIIRKEIAERGKKIMQAPDPDKTPSKTAPPNYDRMHDVASFLQSDPSQVSIELAFKALENRINKDISKDEGSVYVVDFLPNLRYLLKSNMAVDCYDSLSKFETKYPISFALNFDIPPDKVSKPLTVPCATPDGQKDKAKGKKEAKEEKKESDEADWSKTKKRIEAYLSHSQNYLNYFKNSNRLITIDVSCGQPDLIWNSVHKLMHKMDFRSFRTVNSVLLFAFNEIQVQDVDLERFDMQVINLCELVSNPKDPVEKLAERLSVHINNQSKETESFVVNVAGTSMEPEEIEKRENKPITFAEMSEGALEYFLPGSPQNYRSHPDATRYKSVSSSENEIFLFPLNVSDINCQRIAAHMAAQRVIK